MIRRILLVLGALLAIWLALCAALFVWPRTEDLPVRADAVVVLSGGQDRRLNPALELMRHGIAPVLAISSPFQSASWKKAQRLCRGKLATRYAVVCFEAKPFSTQGEARGVAALARTHHWNRVVVVTSTFHVTRARMLFHRCWDGKLWFVGTGSTWWRLPEEWANETGKLLVQLAFRRRC